VGVLVTWEDERFRERCMQIFAQRKNDEITDEEATEQINEAERELRRARAERIEVPW